MFEGYKPDSFQIEMCSMGSGSKAQAVSIRAERKGAKVSIRTELSAVKTVCEELRVLLRSTTTRVEELQHGYSGLCEWMNMQQNELTQIRDRINESDLSDDDEPNPVITEQKVLFHWDTAMMAATMRMRDASEEQLLTTVDAERRAAGMTCPMFRCCQLPVTGSPYCIQHINDH
ncbi:MAG: hypothetical protein [Wigfec virus K19_221]|nr:MAG: hypothetical protein [Wigfec virus K19_221]